MSSVRKKVCAVSTNVFEIKDLFVVSEKNAKLYNVRGQTLNALTYITS